MVATLQFKNSLIVLAAATLSVLAGCGGMHMGMHGDRLSLSGEQEVPPVKTAASGTGRITVGDDRSVSGSVTVTDLNGVAAHIHEAARGANGPVIVPMIQSSPNVWSFPPGAKMSEAQYRAYKAGNTYVNVHSAAHKGGEIRAQLRP